MERGEQVHGEFSGAATTGGAITLYKHGTLTTRTLTAREILVVTDVFFTTDTQAEVGLYADDDGNDTIDPGEAVVHGDFAQFGGVSKGLHTPHYCPPGTGLKIKSSSAAKLKCQIKGYILRA